MSEVQYVGSAEPPITKEVIAPRFDAVIACGMGPVELKASKDPKTNPVPENILNTFNAVATKILVSKGWAKQGILSGYQSRKEPREGIGADVALAELASSEARVLAHGFDQARPKGVPIEAIGKAEKIRVLEEKARTVFGNILEGINLLDRTDPNGYFQGSFGIVAPEFLGPRIAETLKAFGISGGKPVSAEGVLRTVGYRGGERGWGENYQWRNSVSYPDQPIRLQNLQDNPSYVTRELGLIDSPRRFGEVAHALKTYYQDGPSPASLPDCFAELPSEYTEDFDYTGLREKFRATPFVKNNEYVGDIEQARVEYRNMAIDLSRQTEAILS